MSLEWLRHEEMNDVAMTATTELMTQRSALSSDQPDRGDANE